MVLKEFMVEKKPDECGVINPDTGRPCERIPGHKGVHTSALADSLEEGVEEGEVEVLKYLIVYRCGYNEIVWTTESIDDLWQRIRTAAGTKSTLIRVPAAGALFQALAEISEDGVETEFEVELPETLVNVADVISVKRIPVDTGIEEDDTDGDGEGEPKAPPEPGPAFKAGRVTKLGLAPVGFAPTH